MTRRLLAVLAAGALLTGAVGVTQAASYDVGAHLHVGVLNEPADGHPIARAPYTFHLMLKVHDQIGATSYLRIDDSSTTRAKIALVLPAVADLTYAFDWTVDFSGWSVGRHELRWHLDVPHNSQGNRQFTTSRAEVCIGSCSPNVGGRATPWLGGGGWYTSNTYVTAILDSPLTSVTPGGTITIHSQYSRSKVLCAYLNANFHVGDHGTILACFGAGTGKHAVAIPASANVGDGLLILSHDGNEGGVLKLLLGDGSDRATYDLEINSWWSKTGLVLP
jgi:hypothetical protein